MNTWRHWLHGLGAACIGSLGTLAGAGITGYVSNFDLDAWNFWEPLIGAVLLNMWISVLLYIRQFPPPGTPKPQDPPKA